jgi:hypothetical protein
MLLCNCCDLLDLDFNCVNGGLYQILRNIKVGMQYKKYLLFTHE